jgi:hypothetical protein
MGCQEWVNAAQRYMERVEKGINHHQFEHEINKRDQRIATLERQINDLTSLVHAREPRAPVAQNYDQQTEQINLSHQSNEPFMPAPVQFVPDLSGQVQPPRRPGRPRKIQEN